MRGGVVVVVAVWGGGRGEGSQRSMHLEDHTCASRKATNKLLFRCGPETIATFVSVPMFLIS